jgi:hypothetical protein
MKKSILKALIQAVLTECKTCGCGWPDDRHLPEQWVGKGSEEKFTPAQKTVVDRMINQWKFKLVSTRPEGEQVVAVLSARIAVDLTEIEVMPDGSIKKIVEEQSATGAVAGYSTPFAFKKTKKEGMTTRAELDTDMMKAVNVEENTGEVIFKDRQGGRDVYWMDNRDTGGKIFIKPENVQWYVKKGYRVVELEREEVVKEMTSTGAVAGYSTPFAFTKNKKGSQRALDVTKKMGFKPTGIEDKRNH